MAEAFLKWADPKPMTRFSSLTTRAGRRVARNCNKREGIIYTFFQRLFFNKTNLKLIKKQEKLSGGPRACSPGKF